MQNGSDLKATYFNSISLSISILAEIYFYIYIVSAQYAPGLRYSIVNIEGRPAGEEQVQKWEVTNIVSLRSSVLCDNLMGKELK